MLGHKLMAAVKKGIQGILVGPTQITTSTASTATAYSNQRKIDRTSNGVLWTCYVLNPTNQYIAYLSYSLDDGATWNTASNFENASNANSSSYSKNVSFFIDQDDYAHIVYKDNGNGYIYYRRGTPNAGRTAWTWSAATAVISTSYYDYPDIVAHREGTGWAAHVVATRNVDSNNAVVAWQISVTSGGVISVDGGTQLPEGGYGNTLYKYPSIDFNHTGDGKTVAGGTPHLYVAWSAGATGAGKGIRFKKATYSGGSWTWGTEREIDSTVYADTYGWLNCLFDGTRIIIGGYPRSAAYGLKMWERDSADTTTTERALGIGSSNTEAMYSGSLSYDAAGNVYFLGVTGGPAPNSLGVHKWARQTATLESRAVIDSSVILTTAYASAKRGYSNNRIEFVYTDGTASPYNVKYGGIK